MQELLADTISSKKNKGNTQQVSNLKGKWDTLTSEESDNKEYDDENKSKHYRRLWHYGTPTSDVYSSSRMITKIEIYQQQ